LTDHILHGNYLQVYRFIDFGLPGQSMTDQGISLCNPYKGPTQRIKKQSFAMMWGYSAG